MYLITIDYDYSIAWRAICVNNKMFRSQDFTLDLCYGDYRMSLNMLSAKKSEFTPIFETKVHNQLSQRRLS